MKLHGGGVGSCDTPLVILFLTKDLNLFVSLTYKQKSTKAHLTRGGSSATKFSQGK